MLIWLVHRRFLAELQVLPLLVTFPQAFDLATSEGTVLTDQMHDIWSWFQPSNDCDLPRCIASGISSQWTCASHTCFESLIGIHPSFALLQWNPPVFHSIARGQTCEPFVVATLRAFPVERHLWHSYWLKLLGTGSSRNFYWTSFPLFKKKKKKSSRKYRVFPQHATVLATTTGRECTNWSRFRTQPGPGLVPIMITPHPHFTF